MRGREFSPLHPGNAGKKGLAHPVQKGKSFLVKIHTGRMDRRRRNLRWLYPLYLRGYYFYRRRAMAPLPLPPPPPPPPVPPVPPQGQGRRARQRRGNIPRVRLSPLGLTDLQVLTTYRFDMATITYILRDIEEDLSPQINIDTAIPPMLKLLSVLHFCATGSYQHTTGMLHGLAQPTFSVILSQVMAAILSRAGQHIYMPRTPQEFTANKMAFHAIARFPRVIGCVDCTHVALVPPSAHEQAYRNRKMTHSMNVQMVCDAQLCIQHVCARFPGSVHDARILRASVLEDFMEQRVPPHTLLLGDCGYPLLAWLMTPLRNPQTPAEIAYNHAHIRTRSTIERTFGLLKSRFRCLDRTGGALIYQPEKVGEIVALCAVLHNIAIRRRVPMPEPPAPGDEDDDDDQGGGQQPPQPDANAGRRVRNLIITNFFT